MKLAALILLATAILLSTGFHSTAQSAQTKFACVSISEVVSSMPETRKADTTLMEYRSALAQKFEDMKSDYTAQATLLSSRDTSKLTKPQLDIKRQSLAELLAKLQGYDQNAGELLEQKRLELFQPIQKKAEDFIAQVSKENGYSYVFEKEGLHFFPPGDDITALVKKKLSGPGGLDRH